MYNRKMSPMKTVKNIIMWDPEPDPEQFQIQYPSIVW